MVWLGYNKIDYDEKVVEGSLWSNKKVVGTQPYPKCFMVWFTLASKPHTSLDPKRDTQALLPT